MLDVLDELHLPACHLINSSISEYAPSIPKALMARGDEFIGHGRTNAERQGQMWEDEEAALLRTVRDTIAEHTGKAPRGWMGPWISESFLTPDLLQELDYRFVMDWPCDDQPLWMNTRAGKIMSMPYSLDLNDSTQMLHHHLSPKAYGDMLIDRFEEMKNQSRKRRWFAQSRSIRCSRDSPIASYICGAHSSTCAKSPTASGLRARARSMITVSPCRPVRSSSPKPPGIGRYRASPARPANLPLTGTDLRPAIGA
jgi:hypothetical protein